MAKKPNLNDKAHVFRPKAANLLILKDWISKNMGFPRI